MQKIVQVAQYHIENGKQMSGCHCPVALAIAVVLPAGWEVQVGNWGFQIRNGRSVYEGVLPKGIPEKIRIFDDTGKMEPFAFEISIPDVLFEEVPRAEL